MKNVNQKKKTQCRPHFMFYSRGLGWWEEYKQIQTNKGNQSPHITHNKQENKALQSKPQIRNSKGRNQLQQLYEQSSINANKYMASVILYTNIQMRLKI